MDPQHMETVIQLFAVCSFVVLAYILGRMHRDDTHDDEAEWHRNRTATDDELMLSQRMDEIAWGIAHQFSDEVTFITKTEKAQLRAIIVSRVLGEVEKKPDDTQTDNPHARSATP